MEQNESRIVFGEQDEKLFKQYCETLRILNESTDDYLYIARLDTGRFYFWGNLAGRYPLPRNPENGYSLEEYSKAVYDHDAAALEQDIRYVLEGRQDTHDMEYRLVDREGNQVWISCRGKVVYDEAGRRLFMMGRISDTVLLGKTDSLTALFNISKFMEDFEETLRQNKEGTLLVLGVDNFKYINKKYGRAHGNRILKNVTVMMENCIDDKFRIYRLDGDHFAINFVGYQREMVASVYESIRRQLGEDCTFSAGAVTYPLTGISDANTIYMYAESTLDRAKKAGKNQLVFFSVEDYTKQLYLIDLADEMRRSIQNHCDGFFLCYQPKVAAQTMEVVGAEALLRYRSAYHGVVLPGVFISILEQNGMIVPVGNWVLQEAMRQCKEWRKLNPKFTMSINLSYVQLQQKELSDTIYELLDRFQLPGDAVVMELTESMPLQDFTNFNQLFYQWGRRGIQVSVDDFGTGYSGLSYLKGLAVDEVKIDRSFISSIQLSAYNYRLLQNVLELAHSVQIRVCCEGVETADEMRTLKGLRPELMQGYYFSKPVGAEEFERRYLYDSKEQEDWKKDAQTALEQSDKADSLEWRAEGCPEDAYKTVLDQLEEVVYVSDADSYELYYMNTAAKRFVGINDYEGKPCYQVCRKADQPCAECLHRKLDTTKFMTSVWDSQTQGKMFVRDKLIHWNGKPARLEIAYDLSAMGQLQAEMEARLEVSEQTVRSIAALIENRDLDTAIRECLCETGTFYKADRCYLFLYSENHHTWSNLYEWCENQVESMQAELLSLPEELVGPWMKKFAAGKAEIVPDIDVYKEFAPKMWKTLYEQNIRRLIVVPFLHDGKVIGFIGVDNPKKNSYHEELLARVAPMMGAVLLQKGMMTADEKGDVISETLNLVREADILKDMRIGMWMIETDTNADESRMYADKGMKELLGVEERQELSGEECYAHWHGNIVGGYQSYVEDAVRDMMLTGKIVELEYPWQHPVLGEVPVRCVGRLSKAKDGVYTYKGYHLITKDMLYKHLPRGEAIKRQYVRKEDFYQAILSETSAYAEVDMDTGMMLSGGGFWEKYLTIGRQQHLTFQRMQDAYARDVVAEEDYKNYYSHINVDHVRQSYEDGAATVNLQFRRKNEDEYHWMELFVHAFKEPETGKMYALYYLKDINDKKVRQLENERAATRDPLTNALNRKAFEEKTVQYMEEDAREGESCAFLIFDIDDFKDFNDQYGHQGGDDVLRAFVDILRETFRRTDYIGRFGGDEFVVFLKNYVSREILDQRLDEFQKKLSARKPYAIYCSIGIAVMSKEAFDYETCLGKADEALYESKNAGKNRYSYRQAAGGAGI
ncbi:MAG: diguanylate cyclase [Clostridium sp.]|nr:diguanylate cyclase [Clostridium sp.]